MDSHWREDWSESHKFDRLIKKGDIVALDKLITGDSDMDVFYGCINLAVKYGNFEVVKWFHEQDMKGRFIVIQQDWKDLPNYMFAPNHMGKLRVCTSWALRRAFDNNNVDMMRWLVTNRPECNPSTDFDSLVEFIEPFVEKLKRGWTSEVDYEGTQDNIEELLEVCIFSNKVSTIITNSMRPLIYTAHAKMFLEKSSRILKAKLRREEKLYKLRESILELDSDANIPAKLGEKALTAMYNQLKATQQDSLSKRVRVE